MMEIFVRHNGIYLKHVHLGKGFDDMTANLSLNEDGRARVFGTNTSFLTDFSRLPADLLEAVSTRLETEAGNKALERIKQRIQKAKPQNDPNPE